MRQYRQVYHEIVILLAEIKWRDHQLEACLFIVQTVKYTKWDTGNFNNLISLCVHSVCQTKYYMLDWNSLITHPLCISLFDFVYFNCHPQICTSLDALNSWIVINESDFGRSHLGNSIIRIWEIKDVGIVIENRLVLVVIR